MSVRVACVLAEIRTEHVWNTSLECHHHANPLRDLMEYRFYLVTESVDRRDRVEN
jgi:hypothetical protein